MQQRLFEALETLGLQKKLTAPIEVKKNAEIFLKGRCELNVAVLEEPIEKVAGAQLVDNGRAGIEGSATEFALTAKKGGAAAGFGMAFKKSHLKTGLVQKVAGEKARGAAADDGDSRFLVGIVHGP